jgi:hypothetical protein
MENGGPECWKQFLTSPFMGICPSFSGSDRVFDAGLREGGVESGCLIAIAAYVEIVKKVTLYTCAGGKPELQILAGTENPEIGS